ncbi:hypothetical protein BU14_0603s0006 [Porphyra umbilicalis]|uniref:Uncharacterized protein n=1 Tax=Porphyra umbilicalis TaxID=2786 RepID=A0A1X6NRD4_PORUM|nr:hypothetical protein BU14_0603s0006 [Porphyra umbilicalis]|eukprot:OSX71090.1 hypothetical protein BU14_0603s0006 [Porphyra umbilicalis]
MVCPSIAFVPFLCCCCFIACLVGSFCPQVWRPSSSAPATMPSMPTFGRWALSGRNSPTKSPPTRLKRHVCPVPHRHAAAADTQCPSHVVSRILGRPRRVPRRRPCGAGGRGAALVRMPFLRCACVRQKSLWRFWRRLGWASTACSEGMRRRWWRRWRLPRRRRRPRPRPCNRNSGAWGQMASAAAATR